MRKIMVTTLLVLALMITSTIISVGTAIYVVKREQAATGDMSNSSSEDDMDGLPEVPKFAFVDI